MTDEELAIKQFLKRKNLPYADACGCLGPRGDDPLCPCRMKWTETVNNKIYLISNGETIGEWVAVLVEKA